MVPSFRILRDDGAGDAITSQAFASYDEAHAVLERYYADLCCSDDRHYYRIEEGPLDLGA
ncbi:MAG: hypothetical protein NTU65_10995 [Cyanobacteria bacterium]|nr:hypothetical protein [Cyanobacteriota bacterium]